MSEHEVENGIDRRRLLKIGATTAWVAPVVVTSLASPAAAASTTIIGTACSYVLVVYKNNSTGTKYIAALENGVPTCTFRDTVSGDVDTGDVNTALAGNPCAANYSLVGNQLRYSGAAIASEGVCRISYVGQTISITAGYSILFTLDHNGTHSGCGAGNLAIPGENKVRYTCSTGTSSVSTCC